jgi:cell division protein FtsI (penicillin-binding protein 3)
MRGGDLMSMVHFLLAKLPPRETVGATRIVHRRQQGTHPRSLQAKSRLRILMIALLIAYGVISGKLIVLGLRAEPEISGISRAPQITASRPEIVDRNGQLLATDIRTVSLFAEPMKIVDADEAVEKLTTVFPDLDRKGVYEKLTNKRSHFAWLQRQLSPKQQSQVLDLGIPALGFRPEVRRFYPGGRTAAHILGYVDIDNRGVSGMEKYLDQQGLSDLASTGLLDEKSLEPLKLSIDLRVQNIVHDVVVDALTRYESKAAGAVILDIRTGEASQWHPRPTSIPTTLKPLAAMAG